MARNRQKHPRVVSDGRGGTMYVVGNNHNNDTTIIIERGYGELPHERKARLQGPKARVFTPKVKKKKGGRRGDKLASIRDYLS